MYMYTQKTIDIYTYKHIRMYFSRFTHIHIYLYIYTYIYIYMYTDTHLHTDTHIHIIQRKLIQGTPKPGNSSCSPAGFARWIGDRQRCAAQSCETWPHRVETSTASVHAKSKKCTAFFVHYSARPAEIMQK